MPRENNNPAIPAQIRLPLNVGVSALWNLSRAALALLPGCYVLLSFYLILFGLHDGSMFWYGVYAYGAFFAVHSGWDAIKQVLREWPSDAVLTEEGIRIERDPLPLFVRFLKTDYRPNLFFTWVGLQGDTLQIENHQRERFTLWRLLLSGFTMPLSWVMAMFGAEKAMNRLIDWGFRNVPYTETSLYLCKKESGKKDPVRILLARGENPLDNESVLALADTLKNRIARESAGGRAEQAERQKRTFLNANTAIDRLTCPHCGSANPPDEAERTQCLYCHQEIPVPAEMRERLRAVRETMQHDGHSEDLLAALMRQGKSRWASLRLKLGGAALLILVPLLYLGYEWFDRRSMVNIILVLIFGFFFVTTYACVFFITRASLVNRRALRLITLGFAAVPPANVESPHLCRGCGAPLRPEKGRLVVTCLYCSTQNILGLDFRPELKPSEEQEKSLASAFSDRRRERVKWALASLGCIPLLLVSVLMGYYLWWWANSAIGELAACVNDNADYCFKLADRFAQGDGAAKSAQNAALYRLEGIRILEKRCGRKNPTACTNAGYHYFRETSFHKEAFRLYKRGCDYKEPQSCKNLGTMYQFGQSVKTDLAQTRLYFEKACKYGMADACKRLQELAGSAKEFTR